MHVLVFDTAAVFNFGHRGELTFLLEKFAKDHKFLTTPAVVAEITDPERKTFYQSFLSTWFKVQSAITTPFELPVLARLTRTLDPGEITVMMLAKELKATAVLDEVAARAEADLLAIKIVGTLGLLHEALKRKWMTDADCLGRVGRLCDTGFSIRRPRSTESFTDYLRTIEKE
jgi:predicted nucleic acid-binding protein